MWICSLYSIKFRRASAARQGLVSSLVLGYLLLAILLLLDRLLLSPTLLTRNFLLFKLLDSVETLLFTAFVSALALLMLMFSLLLCFHIPLLVTFAYVSSPRNAGLVCHFRVETL